MKWALVTGAAKRTGAEFCLSLARQGITPIVHYQTSQELAELTAARCRSEGVVAETIYGDFSTASGVAAFIDEYRARFSSTDYLIHNVGNYVTASLLEMKSSDWYALFQTNLHAVFEINRALVPFIIKARGRIIHLGVSGLHTRAYSKSPAYMMTKECLLAMTKALALELAPHGVTVNMVSPGQLEISHDYSEGMNAVLPMGRAGRVEEVARVVMFLLRPDSVYVTGQNVEVAGGYHL